MDLFLDPAGDVWARMLTLEATFLVLAFAYAHGLAAARAGRVVSSPCAIRVFDSTGGAALVGAGAWTASRAG